MLQIKIYFFNLRYILDGDREELRNIRNELSSLRNAQSSNAFKSNPSPAPQWIPQSNSINVLLHKNSSAPPLEEKAKLDSEDRFPTKSNTEILNSLIEERDELLSSGLYDPNDSLLMEIEESILEIQAKIAENVGQ
jgi:hypothetical protein